MFKRYGYFLLIFEAMLGVAHLLWPEFRWGQGRRSYFHFENSLTLASWLAGMQLVGVAILGLIGFHRDRKTRGILLNQPAWPWLAGAMLALILSVVEITRFPVRLQLLGLPAPGLYEQFFIYTLWGVLLMLFGWFLLARLRHERDAFNYAIGWLIFWGLKLGMTIAKGVPSLIPQNYLTISALISGLTYLSGGTLLLMALGTCILRPQGTDPTVTKGVKDSHTVYFPEGSMRIWVLIGVGGMTFTIIFLQIILFRLLTVFGDYLTANSVISIALLGISAGGLIGFIAAARSPLQTMIVGSVLLPLSILAAFGVSVGLMDTPLVASVLLTLPFICSSTVITVALARAKSHLVYFIDLMGAGLGALLVSGALSLFREESSLLFLGAFTFMIAICFIIPYPRRASKGGLLALVVAGVLGCVLFGSLNLESDWLNIVRTKVLKRYPTAEVLFSRSTLVGRYDVIRRAPHYKSVAALENGRIIDNMRRRPTDQYQIDPRLPHTLMQNPVILILGLSGDGITKTSKFLGQKVYGVEINPAVVSLQTNELLPYNTDSYAGIEVAVMDGRSFVEYGRRHYDMITLMNAHLAQGRTEGRAPCPEYLHTREAMNTYLDHLTERGVIIVEEPVNWPRREPPVWKLLATMREALCDHGATNPEQHFFIFQWRTRRNNYIQILMKKNPLTEDNIVNLKKWLKDVDVIRELEAKLDYRLGPIRCKTTLLHSPDESFSTNYARILRGNVSEDFLRARNLRPTSDNRPFHFDVDPAHPRLKASYIRTLLMLLLIVPFFLFYLGRNRSEIHYALPYMLIAGLTGMGYFLVEMVLIQRYAIYLVSPVFTFSTILGTLLIFSGLGSLWSGRLDQRGLLWTLAAILGLLILHQWWVPLLFPLSASLPITGKVALAIGTVAPLAFFLGVPFPFVMRTGKARIADSAAAMLFAVNAAASALAVSLALNISTSFGLNATFQTGIVLYLGIGGLFLSIGRRQVRYYTYVLTVIIVSLLVTSPWLMNRSALGVPNNPDHYKLFGISYGHSTYGADRIFQGGSSAQRRPFEWLFWVIRGNGRTILVDTGFDEPRMARKWHIGNYTQPVERLRELGIAPSDVTDVILTHLHWDHAGSLGVFNNARIWLQAKEYEYAKSKVSSQKQKAKGMRWRDLEIIMAAERDGRLELINGEKDLQPGITLTLDGSHTPGHQYVEVETLDGRVIISGDATYLYENNQKHRPVGGAYDQKANLQTIKTMQRNAASPFFILPGHDPLVMRWFPAISRGIVQITSVAE